MADGRVLLGVVGRAHGVRGLVRVHSYTADPRALAEYGRLTDERGQAWSLEWRGDGIAALRGPGGPVADRSAAERLVNTRLYVERSQLPEPEEDEFYLHDLIGMEARDPGGASLGTVSQVHDYGAGASLEIDRHPVLIVPFTRDCVPVVDTAARRVVVVPPVELVSPAEALAEAPTESSTEAVAP